MDKVAFLWNGKMVLWQAVFIALGALSAVLFALALRRWRRERLLPLLCAFPFAVLFSLFFGRLIHWYCRFEFYGSLAHALGDPFTGEYSLMGAFAGTVLALALTRLVRLEKNLPALLDCCAPAAALGIAAGRLGALFSAADRGKMIFEREWLHHLPWSAAVANPVSGAVE
ncbi:MAG: prolipoprotein diacylglyceryl transferase, partial [Oscillospiraceae bacterium]|nr:prolipoprotein diacylglyceryl transferase [Oscillospiraceae bacterium]